MQNFSSSVILALLSAAGLSAATLSTVPMQGGMVMPMFSYDAEEDQLRVMLDPAIPELTPLLVSHPADDFDPADPWHEALSPAQEGRSFSRRYGFVMNTMTDPLPPGRELWIRKLSGTAGLGVYHYSTSEPKTFEPIFGTDGTTEARPWNGMMYHPTFTAPSGTNAHSATFEAYVVDSNTGSMVPNSTTGPFELKWTNVRDGRPAVSIAPGPVVSWAVTEKDFSLEAASDLVGASWTPVETPSTEVEGRITVVLEATEILRFFRLKLTP